MVWDELERRVGLHLNPKSRINFLFLNKASFTHAAKHTLVKLTILPILDFGTLSSRYISLVTPKANSSFGRLSFQFSAANDWN